MIHESTKPAMPVETWDDFLARAQALEARMTAARRPVRVLAIDPGSTTSGVVLVEADPWAYATAQAASVPRIVEAHDALDNAAVLEAVPRWATFTGALGLDDVVIEKIEFMGMAVGRHVFDTVHWSGRFYQAFAALGLEPQRQPFASTRLALLGSRRATEAQVKAALLALHGFQDGRDAKGTAAAPGPWAKLAGQHAWSALALAVGWVVERAEQRRQQDRVAAQAVARPAAAGAVASDSTGAAGPMDLRQIAGDGWPIGEGGE